MLPNFLIAGTSRSGTTSLYKYMSNHPDISFPNIKEPRYFSSYNLMLPQAGPGDSSVDKKLITDFDSYIKLYSRISNLRVGDASSEYLYSYKTSIPEINEKLGDIPIIIMLRSPIERSYSAYNNLVRDSRENLSFKKAIEKESERIIKGYDMMWHYKSVSFYYEQVKAFKSNFSNVKIIIFEHFIKNPQLVLNDIFIFLNLNPLAKVNTDIKYSKSGVPKNRFVSLILGRKNLFSSTLRLFLKRIFGRTILEKFSYLFIKKPSSIDIETKNKLAKEFKNDIIALEKLLDLDLKIWKKV